MLRLSDELALPLDAITETFGILAKRGTGKSSTAVVMAEEMYKAGLPFIVIDPVGKWWGLRSAADGKAPGIPIPIFGGQHGDVPLERSSGMMIADLIVEKRLSCILDVFDFSEGDKIKFLCDFFERLYKKNTEPLHLFFEEADDYIPQKPMHEQARLLRACENVVRRGRANGLGMTMITQRSASLNKNVLTQIETLMVMRTTAPNDRKAIAAWVEYYGQDRELLGSLHELKNGEAWVWSPQWLNKIVRTRIRRRWTFDSHATPKMASGGRKPATLADVDLNAVRKNMADVIERAKQDDPRELKVQIQQLKRELSQKAPAVPAVPVVKEIPILSKEQTDSLAGAMEELHSAGEAYTRLGNDLNEISKRVLATSSRIKVIFEETRARLGHASPVSHGQAIKPASQPLNLTREGKRLVGARIYKPSAENMNAGELSKGCVKILDALVWMETVGLYDPKRSAVAFLAGQSSKSSQYEKNLSKLRGAGCIEYLADARMKITETGRGATAPAPAPLTTSDLQSAVLRRLPRGQADILQVLISAYPESILRTEVAEQAGQSRTSSQFEKNLSKLRGFDLIDYPDSERAVALPVLFLSDQ